MTMRGTTPTPKEMYGFSTSNVNQIFMSQRSYSLSQITTLEITLGIHS